MKIKLSENKTILLSMSKRLNFTIAMHCFFLTFLRPKFLTLWLCSWHFLCIFSINSDKVKHFILLACLLACFLHSLLTYLLTYLLICLLDCLLTYEDLHRCYNKARKDLRIGYMNRLKSYWDEIHPELSKPMWSSKSNWKT